MRRLAALVLGSCGCAPAYQPSAAHLAMLEQRGDVVAQGSIGLQGVEADASAAVTDAVAVRGRVQWASFGGSAEGTRWLHAAAGFGGFVAADNGVRLSASYELGPALASGVFDETYRLSGVGVVQAVPLDLAWESPYFGVGLVFRPVLYALRHDSRSAGEGTSVALMEETYLVARVGARAVKVEAQLGLWLPIATSSNVELGVPFPGLLDVAVVVDLPKAARTTSP